MDDATPGSGAELRAVIGAFPGQRFAVLDGAQFSDLPALCKRLRLFARSLFLDHADAEVEKAGPWLTALDQAPDAVDAVLSLAGAEPRAVYWSCVGGEAVLYRHLRTLNMARIPRWAVLGGTVPPNDGSGLEPVPVMFRHWDPRVIEDMMPALAAAQFSRVLGPCEELAFLSERYGKVRRIIRSDAWPKAPPGLLTLDTEALLTVTAARHGHQREKIEGYLRALCPDEVAAMGRAQFTALVDRSIRSAEAAGLRQERSQGIWAYLMLSSHESFDRLPKVRAFLRTGPGTPDENVEVLLSQMARLADTDREVA